MDGRVQQFLGVFHVNGNQAAWIEVLLQLITLSNSRIPLRPLKRYFQLSY
jgi:hypothetical protein